MSVKIDVKDVLNDLKASVKVDVDLDGFAIKQLDKIVIPFTDLLLAKLTKLIPGQIDDVLLGGLKPQLYADLKREVAEALQKIEDKIEGELEPKASEV